MQRKELNRSGERSCDYEKKLVLHMEMTCFLFLLTLSVDCAYSSSDHRSSASGMIISMNILLRYEPEWLIEDQRHDEGCSRYGIYLFRMRRVMTLSSYRFAT